MLSAPFVRSLRKIAIATATENLPKIWRGYGPVPSVEHASIIGGGQARVGAVRQLKNSDGSVAEEEILELTAPSIHRYRLARGLKFPFSAAVKWGEGTWRFSTRANSTHIHWGYVFELTSPLAIGIAFPVVRLFERAMARGLENVEVLARREG